MDNISSSKKLRLWLGRYKWLLIGLMWVLVILLGYVGFTRHFNGIGETHSVGDNLYRTIQLFVLESGAVSEPIGWELQIARFLAPAMAVFTAIQAVASIFWAQIQLLRVRFIRNHVVICGLGHKGFLLSQAFRNRGERVVLIEQDTGNVFLGQCRESGIAVLIGNAADPVLLRQARVDRAKYVICVCGNDGANAEIAVNVHKQVSGRKGKTLPCLAHIYDPQLYNLLREREMAIGEVDTFRLEFFNVFESGARVMLQEHPPSNKAPSQWSHIMVVGLGRLGESIVINAARTWWESQAKDSSQLSITVIDKRANAKKESLCLRYPQLEKACELVPKQMDVKEPDFERGDFLLDDQGYPDVNVVYVCLDDDSEALSTALILHRQLKALEIPIVVRMLHEAGLATLIRKKNEDHDSLVNLHAFGLLERTCTPELIFGCTYEILARATHEKYITSEMEKGSTPETNPSMIPWEELPEVLRESNRNQVEHIRVKLEAIGCDIVVSNAWEVQPFHFSKEEVDFLAHMEHARWVDERKWAGFRYGTTDNKNKTHLDLVTWEQLPEEEKQKDRDVVYQLSELLSQARFQIYRFKEKPG